ncbi:Protein of unknown function [Cotesia congregata]|uniref:Uncharacterized protein n=1 Tax=Cotesia congregata TaxID=51543 RepID=A0A8J2MM61_COTCN|nr:Protein of unknown function [Cotesia congregata]
MLSSIMERSNQSVLLCGLIGYNAHHYIAYCRRLCGDWRFYNDLMKESKPIRKHTKILPHGVLYILEKSLLLRLLYSPKHLSQPN